MLRRLYCRHMKKTKYVLTIVFTTMCVCFIVQFGFIQYRSEGIIEASKSKYEHKWPEGYTHQKVSSREDTDTRLDGTDENSFRTRRRFLVLKQRLSNDFDERIDSSDSVSLPQRPSKRGWVAQPSLPPPRSKRHRTQWNQGTDPPHPPQWDKGIDPPYPPRWNQVTDPPYPPQWNQGTDPPYPPRWNKGTDPPHPPRWNQGTDPPYPPRWNQGTDPPHPQRWKKVTDPPHPPRWNKGTDPPHPPRWNKVTDPPYPPRWNKGTDPPYPPRWNKGTDPPYPPRWNQVTDKQHNLMSRPKSPDLIDHKHKTVSNIRVQTPDTITDNPVTIPEFRRPWLPSRTDVEEKGAEGDRSAAKEPRHISMAGHPHYHVTTDEVSQIKYHDMRNGKPQRPEIEDRHSVRKNNIRNLSANVPRKPYLNVPSNPSVNIARNPSLDVPRNPSVGVSRSPSVGVPRNPFVGVRKNPSVAVRKNPSVGVHKNPSVGVTRNPFADVRKNPSIDVPRNPSVGSRKNVSVGVPINRAETKPLNSAINNGTNMPRTLRMNGDKIETRSPLNTVDGKQKLSYPSNQHGPSKRTCLVDGVFWTSALKQFLPIGLSPSKADAWLRVIKHNQVKSVAGSEWNKCGRPKNAVAFIAEGPMVCARYRAPHDRLVLGEVMSYWLSRFLGLTTVPPVALSMVNSSQWSTARNAVKTLDWKDDQYTALILWISDIENDRRSKEFMPEPILKAIMSGQPWFPIGLSNSSGNCSLDNTLLSPGTDGSSPHDNIRRLSQLAQWGNMIIFDYITGNYDRVASMQDAADSLGNNKTLREHMRNLPVSKSTGTLWLIDNESGLLDSYELLYRDRRNGIRFQRFHRTMLQSLCVFDRELVERVAYLHSHLRPDLALEEFAMQHDHLIESFPKDESHYLLQKYFSSRLKDILDWVIHCKQSLK